MGPEETSRGKMSERNLEEQTGSASCSSLVYFAHTADILNKNKAVVSFHVKPGGGREEDV